MFVRIENYLGLKDNFIILNIDRISSIRTCTSDNGFDYALFQMDTNYEGTLNQEQYEQICKILTTRG